MTGTNQYRQIPVRESFVSCHHSARYMEQTALYGEPAMVFEEDPARGAATLPTLDEYGLLWRQEKWVALSPIEERLIKAFLAEPGRVINRNVLGHAGWPGGAPNVRSVDARIKALRRRVEPLAVRIHTVRGHGYLADFNPES